MNIIKSLFYCLVTVALLSYASPGRDMGHLAYIAYIPMLLAVRGESSSRLAFLYALFTGFLFYIINMHWITDTITLYGDFYFVIKISLAGLVAMYLAVYTGIFGMLYTRWNTPLTAASIFTALEMLRGTLFSGLPWLNLAYTQYDMNMPIQIVSIIGEYGLIFIIILINIMITELLLTKSAKYVAYTALCFAILLIGGFVLQKTSPKDGEKISARIVQPGYDLKMKWKKEKKSAIFNHVNSLILKAETDKFDLVVMPETVYPAYIQLYTHEMEILGLVSENKPLLMGRIRFEDTENDRELYNSASLFYNKKIENYNKMHLVPFGEYFPLKSLLKPINQYFFGNAKDYTKGVDPVVFELKNMKIAPLICYEGVFSSLVLERVKNGANVIAIITNDGWFADSIGRYQHLAADVLRAVEFRRTIIRASSDGISAYIKPDGSIDKFVKEKSPAYLDSEVLLVEDLTFFAMFNYMPLVIVFIYAIVMEFRRRDKKIIA